MMKKQSRNPKWRGFVSGLVLTTFLAGAGPALAALPVGSVAPDFTLEDVYGVTHSLSDYAGTMVILGFFSPT